LYRSPAGSDKPARTLARGFSGVVASQPEQTRFRRGVWRTPTECRLCGNARNVQDNPAFARVHSGQYQLAQQERRTQMNRDNLVEFGDRILLHRHDGPVVPAVVHKNVHAAKGLSSVRGDCPAVGLARQIASEERGLPSRQNNLARGSRKFSFRPRRQENRSAFFSEQIRDRLPNTSPGPRDQRHFVFQQHSVEEYQTQPDP